MRARVLFLGMPEQHYLIGFVGVCLLQYFCRRHPDTAFDVLRRLLTWKIVFTQTLPTQILTPVDVVEMAVKVSSSLVAALCYMNIKCLSSSDVSNWNIYVK